MQTYMHTSTFKNACMHTLTYQHEEAHKHAYNPHTFQVTFKFSFTRVTKLLTKFPQYTEMIYLDWASST